WSGPPMKLLLLTIALAVLGCTLFHAAYQPPKANAQQPEDDDKTTSGNPHWAGGYADPQVAVIDGRYWLFATCSARYDDQLFFDAFSSPDLVTWTKHERVLDDETIAWARRAMWAPCAVEKDGKTYLFFSANDLQRPGGPLYDPNDPKSHTGGIGVAV